MIKSMTSFARCSDQGSWGAATWEIRSVNHRYLDCSFKLPENLRCLEPDLRELVRQKVNRGKVDCFLRYQPGEDIELDMQVNKNVIKNLASATEAIREYFHGQLSEVNPIQVLSWSNALHIAQNCEIKAHKNIINLFKKTLANFITAKKQEGNGLKNLIKQRLPVVLSEVEKARKILPGIIKQQRSKLLSYLHEIEEKLDVHRLEQEMVFFAQKIDVAEELDRIEVHVKEVGRILSSGGVVGKRLDFLMQELNREANTVASKSVDKRTTLIAVELKVLIEQMREQAQNIE